MNELFLGSGRYELTVLPEMGASIANFVVRDGGKPTHLMRETITPIKTSSDAASFAMGPWVGRVKNGEATIKGRVYKLPQPEKHSIHGLVRNLPWNIAKQSETEAAFTFDSKSYESTKNHPFPFTATLTYSVKGNGFRTAIRHENTGDQVQPAGWGFHPYFPASVAAGELVQLQTKVSGVFEVEGIPIPEHLPVTVPMHADFSNLRPVNEGFDTCYSGWQGEALLLWPVSGWSVRLLGSPEMQYLIVFSPPGKPFVAVEPMSTTPNAFNLEANGTMKTNLAWLPPGEVFEAWYDTVVD